MKGHVVQVRDVLDQNYWAAFMVDLQCHISSKSIEQFRR